MENGATKWRFEESKTPNSEPALTVRRVLTDLEEKYLNERDEKPAIIFGHGDPTSYPCFRTAPEAEDAVFCALKSAAFNSYAPAIGIEEARRAVANYLNRDLPYKLSAENVFLTVGCTQAIEVTIKILARPGANILLPRPGYPDYEVHSANAGLEIRYFDLLPEEGWEVDLEAVEALADENTVAMAVINPGNPCGCVYSYKHLEKIAETARKLRVLLVADEVYGHLAFGNTPFVPMGVFASIVPVLTLGSISKRWIAPGWRIGWLVTSDPLGILKTAAIVDKIKSFLYTTSDPATFMQGALPRILESTKDDFFSRIKNILQNDANIFYERIQDIPCITCLQKPEGAMSAMVKLNLSLFNDIADDMDFCNKLAKEESVVVLPGVAVGMKNWLRITFAVDPTILEVGFGRIKAFCERHSKKL